MTALTPAKNVYRDSETGDFAMELNGEVIGYRRTRREAEAALDATVYEQLSHQQHQASEADDKGDTTMTDDQFRAMLAEIGAALGVSPETQALAARAAMECLADGRRQRTRAAFRATTAQVDRAVRQRRPAPVQLPPVRITAVAAD